MNTEIQLRILAFYGASHIELKRLGYNLEQIKEYIKLYGVHPGWLTTESELYTCGGGADGCDYSTFRVFDKIFYKTIHYWQNSELKHVELIRAGYGDRACTRSISNENNDGDIDILVAVQKKFDDVIEFSKLLDVKCTLIVKGDGFEKTTIENAKDHIILNPTNDNQRMNTWIY